MTVVKSKEIIFRVPVFFFEKKKKEKKKTKKKTEHFSKYINIKIEMHLNYLFPIERDCGLNAQLY